MEVIAIVMVLAIVIEAVIQVFKSWIPESLVLPAWTWPVCSAIIGIALCLLANVDILFLAGIQLSVPVVGSILTGIVVSRGSNFVYDVWTKMNSPLSK